MSGDGKLVLVSGCTGYIGSWVAREFLNNGYKVRGTVRSLEKKKGKEHLQKWIEAGDPLELVEANLLDADSWMAACKGVDIVAHVASPFFIGAKEGAEAEEKLYKPAKQGTLNVLRAAQAAGTVKKVVVTSSVAAVSSGREPPALLKNPEELWSDLEKADPYSKSKTLAEMAVWEFVKEQKEAGKEIFDVATVNPCLVFGPPLSSGWATSHEIPKRLLNKEMPGYPNLHMGTVDVRDVAKAHRLAVEVPEAPGKRFIVQGQSTGFGYWAKTLSQEFGPLGYKVPTRKLPYFLLWVASFFDASIRAVLPGVNQGPRDIECKLATEVLGLEFTPEKDSIIEHCKACIDHGVQGFKKTKAYAAKYDKQ